MIYSFGFRHGLTVEGQAAPPGEKACQRIGNALVVDVRRILPKNPYHNKKLRALRGDDEAVIRELESTHGFEQAYHRLKALVVAHQGPVYIGCTGGHHRSVYVANRLAQDLRLVVQHLNYFDK